LSEVLEVLLFADVALEGAADLPITLSHKLLQPTNECLDALCTRRLVFELARGHQFDGFIKLTLCTSSHEVSTIVFACDCLEVV
jgi:hypothetical protein